MEHFHGLSWVLLCVCLALSCATPESQRSSSKGTQTTTLVTSSSDRSLGFPPPESFARELDGAQTRDAKVAVLTRWVDAPVPTMAPTLTRILAGDPDETPMYLMAYACDILGNIGLKHPGSLSDSSVSTLVRGLFLTNKFRQNTGHECGVAVQNVGPTAHAELVKLYKREHQSVQSLLHQYSQKGGSPYPPNVPIFRAASGLISARAPQAGPLFMGTLSGPMKPPTALEGEARAGWELMSLQIVPMLLDGLGALGHQPAKTLLIKIMRGHKTTPAFTARNEALHDFLVRTQASAALNQLGDRSSAPDMLASATQDLLTKAEEDAKAYAQRHHRPMEASRRYAFNLAVMQSYAMLAGAGSLLVFDRAMKQVQEAPLKLELLKVRPALELAEACLAKVEDSVRGACFAARIEDGDPLIRKKAAFEIGRLSAPVATPLIARHLSTTNDDVHQILTEAAYKVPSPAVLKVVEGLLKGETSPRLEDRIKRHRLRYLRGYLTHNLLTR